MSCDPTKTKPTGRMSYDTPPTATLRDITLVDNRALFLSNRPESLSVINTNPNQIRGVLWRKRYQTSVQVDNNQTPFDVTSGQLMMIRLAETNSVDKLPFKEDPNDPYDTDNGGNYGVHTVVTIWAKNPSQQNRTMRVRVAALDVGGPYFGSTDVGYRVGPIRFVNGTPDNVAFVADFQVLANTPQGKPFGNVSIMHAGGAWLPVGILLQTLT